MTRLVKINIKNLNIQSINSNNGTIKQEKNLPLHKRVEAKISDGDIRGATKLLMSSETLANQDEITYNLLKEKHPSPSRDLNLPEPPDATISPLITTEEDVRKSINSFYNGSSGGADGITPQHLKDLIAISNGDSGNKLINSITSLSNLMLRGKIQSSICEIMFGARLCALQKEDGGIRPIAIGSVFRRITAKIACSSVREEIGSYLRPRQMG